MRRKQLIAFDDICDVWWSAVHGTTYVNFSTRTGGRLRVYRVPDHMTGFHRVAAVLEVLRPAISDSTARPWMDRPGGMIKVFLLATLASIAVGILGALIGILIA